jgi:hypothetical protein
MLPPDGQYAYLTRGETSELHKPRFSFVSRNNPDGTLPPVFAVLNTAPFSIKPETQ